MKEVAFITKGYQIARLVCAAMDDRTAMVQFDTLRCVTSGASAVCGLKHQCSRFRINWLTLGRNNAHQVIYPTNFQHLAPWVLFRVWKVVPIDFVVQDSNGPYARLFEFGAGET
jgi:hypothetical protein